MSDFTNALGTEITAQFMGGLQDEADAACGALLHERLRTRANRLGQALVAQLGVLPEDDGLALLTHLYSLHDIADEIEALEERCRPLSWRERRRLSPLQRMRKLLAARFLRAYRTA